jgi:hypothetical protein
VDIRTYSATDIGVIGADEVMSVRPVLSIDPQYLRAIVHSRFFEEGLFIVVYRTSFKEMFFAIDRSRERTQSLERQGLSR